jgi:hypothetical protein
MILFTVFRDYLTWHYSRAFSDIFAIWRNITHFIFHFFSIPLLFRTLFAPWKRIEAVRETEGLNLGDFLATKIVNLIMRLVGAMMRTILIAVGLAVTGSVVVAGCFFFAAWTLLPVAVVVLVLAGAHLLIFG